MIRKHLFSAVSLGLALCLALFSLAANASAAAFAPPLPQAAQQQVAASGAEPAPLSEEHREWLEEDVVYIISDIEQEAFVSLTSDEERDLFIESFWRERDPTPGTIRNQAREDHVERLRYVDRYIGRETPQPGWMSDQGRIHIMLGAPAEVHRFPEETQFWPMELWFYRANPGATDLPPFFYVMFFRPNMSGAYQIYDPYLDGVQSLAKQINLQMAEPRQIVQALLQGVGYEIAHASLSLLPGERPNFTDPVAAPGSEQLFGAIGRAPLQGVDTNYARHFASNRGDVDATVLFGTIPVDLVALSFWDDRGMPYLHYGVQIPPERVLLAEYEEDYYFSMAVSLEIMDLRGEQIDAASDELEEHFGKQQAEMMVRSPFAYYDKLELVPGAYDISVDLRNRISEEGGLVRARISVPSAPADGPVMSDLLVAESAAPAGGTGATNRGFQIAGLQWVPVSGGNVYAGESAHLFAQIVLGSGAAAQGSVAIEGSLVDAEGGVAQTAQSTPMPLRAAPAPIPLTATVPLEGVPPGAYTVRLTARLPDGRTLTRERPVFVSAVRTVSAPMVLMANERPAGNFDEYQARGWQHLRKGETATAEAYFAAGLEEDPGAHSLRRGLANLWIDRGAYADAARLIAPLARNAAGTPGDLLLMGNALRRAGQFVEAAEAGRALLERFPPSVPAYNSLAETLLELGQTAEAAELFRASLGIDPNQPEVQKALAEIGG